MGLFNTLMSKIFGHASSTGAATTTQSSSGGTAGQPAAGGASGATAPTSDPALSSSGAGTSVLSAAPSAPPQQVDVGATLDALAAKNPEHLDWKHSIVDLMKLVGMDSSLAARKELAVDLHYTGDTNDSASMNMWLHKEVLRKLSENGGKVPQELLNK